MSRIILDIECPNCNSEDITYKYNEEDTNIVCKCSDCGWEDIIMNSVYMMEDYEIN